MSCWNPILNRLNTQASAIFAGFRRVLKRGVFHPVPTMLPTLCSDLLSVSAKCLGMVPEEGVALPTGD
jgi:hypothetical protein